MSTMQPRIEGQTLPGTSIYWEERTGPSVTGYVDLSSASSLQVEARAYGSDTLAWTKTTGIVGQAGDATTPSAQITWAAGDLGALTAGRYKLELTGTVGGLLRKYQFDLTVVDQLS